RARHSLNQIRPSSERVAKAPAAARPVGMGRSQCNPHAHPLCLGFGPGTDANFRVTLDNVVASVTDVAKRAFALVFVLVGLSVACSSGSSSGPPPYDRSCSQTTDCVAVPAMPCKCDCSYEAINVREQERHRADEFECGCGCLSPNPVPAAVCSADGMCELGPP
ncbi:MAG TPA: hypothetical protein PKA88_24540, partial [Polyangiaceae bacterium]|nr:hypothetical protein [Polyangiaceae bacterium]